MNDPETPQIAPLQEIPLICIGRRIENGKLVQAWRRPDQKPGQYLWFSNSKKFTNIYPGQRWIFKKDDTGYFTSGEHGPRQDGYVPEEERRVLAAQDRAAQIEYDAAARAKKLDSETIGSMTVGEFRKLYHNLAMSNQRRALLALLLEEVTR